MNTSKFIQSYLQEVFEDFKEIEWCDMNDFKLNTDSYAIPVNQQRYILKYFAAYFCDYYMAYKEVIQKAVDKNINSIDVMSIGCGCGVDFYALERLLLDNQYDNFNVKYKGIDKINWGYCPNPDKTLIP